MDTESRSSLASLASLASLRNTTKKNDPTCPINYFLFPVCFPAVNRISILTSSHPTPPPTSHPLNEMSNRSDSFPDSSEGCHAIQCLLSSSNRFNHRFNHRFNNRFHLRAAKSNLISSTDAGRAPGAPLASFRRIVSPV